MTLNLFQSTSIPALEQTVSFTQSRHEVLAGNIANLDTPGYRVRDLSVETFQKRLGEALEARREPSELNSPGRIGASGDADEPMRRVRESMKSILFHDDSNVGIEQQVTEMSKNQAMHNLAITIMTSQFRLLQAAVSERV